MKPLIIKALKYLYPFAVIACIWEIIFLAHIFPQYWFPSIFHIISLFIKMLFDGSLISYSFISILNTAIGFFCGSILGIILGMIAGTNRHCKDFLLPIIDLVYPIPGIAWLPFILLWFGFGYKAIILTVALGGFFSVFYNTLMGIENISPLHIRAARNLGLGRIDFVRKILFWGSFPFIFTGLRQAYGRSWRTVIAAEMLSFNTHGLGWFLWRANEFFNFDQLLVGVIMIGMVSLVIEKIIFKKIEARTIKRWQ